MKSASDFADWVTFFSVLAGLSATVFSVMFVTFQVRPELWRKSRLKRAVASSALGELIVPLFVSLISLMAGNPWRVAAFVAGAFGVVVIAAHWHSFILDHGVATPFDRLQAKAAWFSLALYVSILVAGTLDPRPGLYIIAGISTWLLLSGAGEAWLLLSLLDESRASDGKRFTKEFIAWASDIKDVYGRCGDTWRRKHSRGE